MQFEAFPTRLVAVADGVCRGQDHVIVYLEHRAIQEVRGFALTRADAGALLAALQLLLAEEPPRPQRLAPEAQP
jgi:hypothetical protein